MKHAISTVGLLMLAGCPYLGDNGYTDRVRDLDGDGAIADRFGGPDCRDDDPSITNCDSDGDGFLTVAAGGDDCNDSDATAFPGAPEQCNDRDDDCDGLVDNDDADVRDQAPLVFRDADGDGHGDPDRSIAWCGDAPPGYVGTGRDDDCDDSNADISPTAPELCDAIDHDCDGDLYAGALAPPSWYGDEDGDGFGDPDDLRDVSCLSPGGTAVANALDCDPSDGAVSPAADEIPYDGIDQDCADGDLTDIDGDGYDGGPGGLDCDDTRGAANPDAQEVCNGEDDDCDGETDNGLRPDGSPVLSSYWPDLDGDLRGDNTAVPVQACVAPANHVSSAGDCDDAVATTYTGAVERCNGIDDDCDTFIDDSPVDGVRRFRDRDLDLYGDPDFTEFRCLNDFDPTFNWVENDDDCDDSSALASPVGVETCDGLDNDCDGGVDDGVGTIRYVDADGDGWGNPDQPVLSCDDRDGELSTLAGDCNDLDPLSNPDAEDLCGDDFRQDCRTDLSPYDCDADGFIDEAVGGDDCNDSEPTAFPGGNEVCDGFDNDCDGLFDDLDPSYDPSTVATWYLDADGDGFASNIIVEPSACSPVPGAATVRGDCNDGDSTIFPGAIEVCDGIDNDCDATVDDVEPSRRTQWYVDTDQDGQGASFTSPVLQQCADPGAGFADNDDDCRDDNDAINTAAPEICDGLDNDCDTLRDDDDSDVLADSWFIDEDGDTFGRNATAVFSCAAPAGYVPDGGDCDDTQASKFPGAAEVCDGLDNDCDALVDDNDPNLTGEIAWVLDNDGDGFGKQNPDASERIIRCAQPARYVLENVAQPDCDDSNPRVNPGAFEVCDNLDNDCDGLANDLDPDLAFAPAWYADVDGDGWGDSTQPVFACTPPGNASQFGGDCNDNAVAINPLASEICDPGIALDNDCDGLTELDGDPDAQIPTWYLDVDGDGFGDNDDPAPLLQCDQPTDRVPFAGDCDDALAAINPAAPERCNEADDDCDGSIDEDAIGTVAHWPDADADGFGDRSALPLQQCLAAVPVPGDPVPNDGDCNDASAAFSPAAPELCDNEDNDCDNAIDENPAPGQGVDYGYDSDRDGFGDFSFTVAACPSVPPTPTELWVDLTGQLEDDCNPTNGAAYPGAPEACDAIDNDCDGVVDNGLAVPWYPDLDNDGYGDEKAQPADIVMSCFAQPGYSTSGTDCDDTTAAASPATFLEFCDGIDNDCDGLPDESDPDSIIIGLVTYYQDLDNDGYGVTRAQVAACARPPFFAQGFGDCDDGRPDVNPGAPERCDAANVDENCNGFADNDDVGPTADRVVLAPDDDGDGVGRAAEAQLQCPDEGLVDPANGDDCNDMEPGLTDFATWYFDADGDGFAAPSSAPAPGVHCFNPSPGDYAAQRIDCNDALPQDEPLQTIFISATDNLQNELDLLGCYETTFAIQGTHPAPILPTDVAVNLINNGGGRLLGPLSGDGTGTVEVSVQGLTLEAPAGGYAIDLDNAVITLEDVTLQGQGPEARGMLATNAVLLGKGLTCIDMDSNAPGSCLAAFGTDLWFSDIESVGSTGVGADITISDSTIELFDVEVASTAASTAVELLGVDGLLTNLQVQGGQTGLRIADGASPTDLTIRRARMFVLAGDGIRDDRSSGTAAVRHALLQEVAGDGIVHNDIAPLTLQHITVVGTAAALDPGPMPSTVALDHAVFWNNGADFAAAPTYAISTWSVNRFEFAGAANSCGGGGCIDAFTPDFIAYAPSVNPLLQLPMPRVGGNLWDRSVSATDDNGTPADLGFSGGPNGWVGQLYATQDDLMPDTWEEVFLGPDILLYLPTDDPDGDGLDNLAEFYAGTLPNDADTDADGGLDGDEIARGCDPLDRFSELPLDGSDCP